MSTLPQRPTSQPGDGLGYRVLGFDKKTGDRLEMLRVRPQFSGQAAFETALRDRLRRLADFRNPAFARVRQIDRLSGQAAGIAVVSNHLEGVRLGDVIQVAESHQVRIDIDTTLSLVRQLVSAVAGLHTCGPDIGHGCLGPERLLLTPDARLVVTEYVLGSALEAMQWSRERYWQEFRIALPPGPDPAIFDQQTDIVQIGLLALALVGGRGIYAERQYPLPLAERIRQAREIPVSGNPQPLKPALAAWLSRALYLDPASAFRSLDDALVALDLVIGEGYLAAPAMVAAFLERCRQASPHLRPRESETGQTDLGRTTSEIVVPTGPATPRSGDTKPGDTRPAARTTPATPGDATGRTSTASPGKPASQPANVPNVGTSAAAFSPGAPGSGGPGTGAPSGTTAGSPRAGSPPAGTPSTTASTGTTSTTRATSGPSGASASTSAGDTSASDAGRGGRSADARPATATFSSKAASAGQSGQATAFLGPEAMIDDSSEVPAELMAAARPRVRRSLLVTLGLATVLAVAGHVVMRYANPFSGSPAQASVPTTLPSSNGILSIDSSPKSATVFIDDSPRGSTPLRLELSPGSHTIRLDGGDNLTRTFPVTVTAGKEIAHIVELSRSAETGALDIRSDPAGARVSIDGKAVGNAPVSIADIAPGDHTVVVEGQQNSVRQTVKVIGGTRSAIVVPLGAAPTSPAAGWLSVASDLELQVLQDGQLLGTSRAERLMMPAGTYELELTNDAVDFRVTRTVQVQPGKVARVSVPVPDGTLSVNATPWAEIWVDGARVGETPVGNLPMRAGSHEIVFRNPKLGEKKQTIVVKPGQPARLTMDMTK